MLESGRHPVFEVAVDAPVPLDVDTWADYEACWSKRPKEHRDDESVRRAPTRSPHGSRVPAISSTKAWQRRSTCRWSWGYRCCSRASPGSARPVRPRRWRRRSGTELIRLQCYEGLTVSESLYEWNYQRQLLAIRLAESRQEQLDDADLFTEEFLQERPILKAVRQAASIAGAADRRDRPGRRRVRGSAAGVPGGVERHDPGAGHVRGQSGADRHPHLQPQPRPARRAASTLPLSLDRVSGGRAGRRHPATARPVGVGPA